MTGVRQLDALTGLRGIAAWLVVLYHIRPALTALLPAEVIAALTTNHTYFHREPHHFEHFEAHLYRRRVADHTDGGQPLHH